MKGVSDMRCSEHGLQSAWACPECFDSLAAALRVAEERWMQPFDGSGVEWHEALPSPYTYQAEDFSKLVAAVHEYEARALAAEEALHRIATLNHRDHAPGSLFRQATEIATDALTVTAAASTEGARGQKITHGRHCVCTPCKQEDWTRITAPCGMHGADCPAVYAPLGAAGDYLPASTEGADGCTLCGDVGAMAGAHTERVNDCPECSGTGRKKAAAT